MKKRGLVFAAITLVLLLVTGGVVYAQDGQAGAGEETNVQEQSGPVGPNLTIAPGAIPVQGRLTDAGGRPLNGTYTIIFNLYDAVDATIPLCGDTRDVVVTNGLFNDVMDHCYNQLTGQKVWLGIAVGAEAEMAPRQVIYPVPYAVSLMPGSQIAYSMAGGALFTLDNSSSSGKGLRSIASSATGINYGVEGRSSSPNGFGGYFANDGGGVGLYSWSGADSSVLAESGTGSAVVADSSAGVAVEAKGTGIIKSSAQSSIWISGNGARPTRTTDTTIIAMTNVGGAKIWPGTTVSNKNVMLPITIPGPLYGQNVKVVGMDIYFQTATEFDVISVVLMRLQKGVCTIDSPTCYLLVKNDPADHPCDAANNAAGCTLHYDLTTNNTITANSGILYLTLELGFGGESGWVHLGGVRLVLEHD